ncbi:glucuronate isomerase [Gracilibacillus halophilus YIM-C55.5]|uniref:Uronate isomerase n=1 Tax=Gracilibacillus halophilus YIM-C55.5 TaxID=1308866 RepID=N4WTS1_9BACI|nr:glucuronate isomerase [Gracilibacillus halophilus]ENH96521.1 glucuronate isomerase [Gracilibacillus halophilus YIM-C55.5]
MKPFMDENFVLTNPTAEKLYHQYAKDLPIIDYHCHLSPQEIYENTQFENITKIWLYGDHYKWRAMRANGVEEKYVTGDASDYDKFLAWAKTVPKLIGNPLYHWTHLELKRYFSVEEPLNEHTAPAIWEKVNQQLNSGEWNVRDFIVKSGVEVVCTTDDPTDSLEFHEKIKADDQFDVKILPSYRPDKGLEINREGFTDWVNKLAEVSHMTIDSYDAFLQALANRINFFHDIGGRVSDHALDEVVYQEATASEVANIFNKALAGEAVTAEEEAKYKSYTLTFLGKKYHEKGWAMQYHINAHRNNNTRMFNELGPDTGYDSMNDALLAKPLVGLLDSLDQADAMPKTILYSLNPRDNVTIATIMGSFQGGGVPGKMQFGTAWWFNDTKLGMINQMETLADIGVFSQFIGMLTDSRSFLSYTRHEYFRRIMCNLIGQWVENGEYPNDEAALADIVQNVSYYNAKKYFQFD